MGTRNPSSSSSSNPRTTTPRSKSTLSATRPRTESPSARAESKQIGDKPEEAGTVSKGQFSYPEGSVTYTVSWVADVNGFQATGDHLPTPPPMPEHVVKLLADLRAAGVSVNCSLFPLSYSKTQHTD